MYAKNPYQAMLRMLENTVILLLQLKSLAKCDIFNQDNPLILKNRAFTFLNNEQM